MLEADVPSRCRPGSAARLPSRLQMIGASVASPYASSGYVALKLEPHLHTVHSDGQDTVQAMFAACQAAGYHVVALTDHNTLSGADEASAVAAELGLILLPG